MRPVELQNSIMQAPSAERSTQQQVTHPQTAQQSFQQQLERTATLRPSQVQAPQPAPGADAVTISPDEHGEQRRRKPARRPRQAPAPAPASPEAAIIPAAGGSKIDVVV